MQTPFTLLKLGGSLITDKQVAESYRADVAQRIASEIATAQAHQPAALVIGHGSGSFGHIPAKKYSTINGVQSPEQWRGFAEVATIAARLSMLFTDTLRAAGLPVWRIQPSASARAYDGVLTGMELYPLKRAIQNGLIPLVHGDVALDEVRGGTIISTETIFTYLVAQLNVRQVILAGEVDGVYDTEGRVIPEITPANFDAVRPALGGSGGVDVTGGMLTKVTDMLALVQNRPGLRVRIINGLREGVLLNCLTGDETEGTLIHAGSGGPATD